MISELPFKSTIPELGKIIDGIEKAGEKILEVYETDFSTEKKDDDSPITQADIESNKILKEVLGETGKMTDISGKEMLYNTESVNHENGILVTNGLIHQDALNAISRLDS